MAARLPDHPLHAPISPPPSHRRHPAPRPSQSTRVQGSKDKNASSRATAPEFDKVICTTSLSAVTRLGPTPWPKPRPYTVRDLPGVATSTDQYKPKAASPAVPRSVHSDGGRVPTSTGDHTRDGGAAWRLVPPGGSAVGRPGSGEPRRPAGSRSPDRSRQHSQRPSAFDRLPHPWPCSRQAGDASWLRRVRLHPLRAAGRAATFRRYVRRGLRWFGARP